MIRYLPIVSLLILLTMFMAPLWIFAQPTYEYRVPITIFNNGSATLGPLGVVVTLNNAQLYQLGYINSSGLNTTVQEGTIDSIYGATEETVGIFIPSIEDQQSRNYEYRLGNYPAQSGFPVVVGSEGNLTILDDDSLELASSNFSLELSGYLDMSGSVGYNKTLIRKAGELRAYVSDDGELTVSTPTTVEFNTTSDDAYFNPSDPDFDYLWSLGSAGFSAGASAIRIGQAAITNYWIYRSVLYFNNTYELPDDADITSARIRLSCTYMDPTGDDWDIVVQTGGPLRPSEPPQTSDFWRERYSGNGGSIPLSDVVEDNDEGTLPTYIELNSEGLSWINTTGPTKFMLRTSDDIAGLTPPPIGQVYADFGSVENPDGHEEAVLEVNYNVEDSVTVDVTTGVHTVTLAAANITQHSHVGSPTDALMQDDDTDYGVAHNASSAGNFDDSHAWFNVGQSYNEGLGKYYIYRGLMYFDTSRVPDEANILSGYLSMQGQSGTYGEGNWTLILQQPSEEVQEPGQASYYNYTYWSGNLGEFDTTFWLDSSSGYNNMTLNGDGLSWINVTGTTILGLRSNDDINHTPPYLPEGPDMTEFLRVVSWDSADRMAPTLVLTYESLEVYLDGSFVGFIGWDSANITNSADNWVLGTNGSIPYLSSYSHYINDTQRGWFEPTVMPGATNLPDRSGNGNTGLLAFGNPSEIEVTIGGMLPASEYTAPGGPSEEVPEVLPTPDVTLHEDPGATGENLPLYVPVSRAADAMGLSTTVLYSLLILIVCAVVGFAGYVASGSVIGFSVGFGMTAAAAGGTAIFPWWIAVLCVLMALFTGYAWRHT